MTKQTNTVFAVLVMVLLMMATRGHHNWLLSFIHLPDFTLPALFIAGVYLRRLWVVFALIISAVLIDNYAILQQGISAHCITPAYGFLLLSYYGVFSASRYLSTLSIDARIVNNIALVVLITSSQWLLATTSYYAFTDVAWAKFPTYIAHWSTIEIPLVLYWVSAIMIVFSLTPRLLPRLPLPNRAR